MEGLDKVSDKVGKITDIENVLITTRNLFFNYKTIFFIIIGSIMLISLIWIIVHFKRRSYFTDLWYLISLIFAGRYAISDHWVAKKIFREIKRISEWFKIAIKFFLRFKIIRTTANFIGLIFSYVYFFIKKIFTKLSIKIDKIKEKTIGKLFKKSETKKARFILIIAVFSFILFIGIIIFFVVFFIKSLF